MRVSDLFIYPLKSARGIALPAADIDAYGLPGDRRAMITDAQGHFITQRELPDLARIEVRPEATAFRLLMQGKTDISVTPPQPENRMDVTVWKSAVSAAVADPESNRQLSEWLGREVRLVFFDGQARRTANAEWAGEATPVTFTDGYQILVTTTGSLKALNADLAAHGEGSVGMERFRPNIVIDTDEAWPEDRWAAIEIAGIRFDLVKPCSRCIMTTQDQLTGSREGPNPMQAMGRIRMSADRRVPGPLFGWNVTPRGNGKVTIGDTVNIVEERPEGWALKRRAAA
ncbi:MOSC domain-containing protein [Rhizobium leguminosarum]|uniref:MOSC domain-containing protein n=1 Tax=Rhizobium leguminosarum TaxID=384 RepID=A0A7M3DRY0_RHILE|nr:MOSC domain-containing protein [Rhizobium leguminosarum]MDV4163125.1 MOSC domain-containing protein [Rhizobium leguminosarum]MDV4172642.1 MOSC domain-containing protein [Rhizobium leguminosarum]QIO72055.1 MOSC domain-containing protein [Rhizobium leguminosarum bv. trifolii]QIO79073.1 MOSC domain-containing protein [Rhizobium leguminosarum bv. trifolii]TAU20146.1 MOSC domain-containing protein [Rhizobium leguminosarum]